MNCSKTITLVIRQIPLLGCLPTKRVILQCLKYPNLTRSYARESLKFIRGAGYFGYENNFTYNIMKENPNYRTTIFNENMLLETPTVFIQDMMKSKLASEDEQLTTICENICKNVKSLSDKELLSVLHAMAHWPINFTANKLHNDTCIILDQECLERIVGWSTDEAFLCADLWYRMQLVRKSDYVWTCVKRYARRMKHLSNSEVVQLLFFMNVCRTFPPSTPQFELEYYLVDVINNITLDEIAIISMAFFKTQTKIKNNTVMASILDKMIKEASIMDNIVLGIICKVIKYSLHPTLDEKLRSLQNRLVAEVPRLGVTTLTHLALTGTNINLCNYELLNKIIERVMELSSTARLKELERVLFVMCLYGIRNEAFVGKVMEELKTKQDEIEKHPRSFISLVNYLVTLDVFPTHLLNLALSRDMTDKAYVSGKLVGHELGYLDASIEIELPDYTGNRLDAKLRRTVCRNSNFNTTTQSPSVAQQMAYEVEAALNEEFGKEFVFYGPVLPHYTAFDFVVGLGEGGSPVAVPSTWAARAWGVVRRPPDTTDTWLCFVVGGRNTTIRDHRTPLGTMQAKIRQLGKLGYVPVLVSWLEWRHKSPELRRAMLRELVPRQGA